MIDAGNTIWLAIGFVVYVAVILALLRGKD